MRTAERVVPPPAPEETLVMTPVPTRGWVKSMGWELWLILLIALIAFAAHGFNMFSFPGFREDEGIYASQAWSVLHEHRLTPYTYTYDHAPAGWLLGALWMLVTGGPETFGGGIFSGRVLVLLLHVASVVLLYRITRKLGGGIVGATVAALLFSLSPLAVPFQRLFILDNLMVFWILVSLNLMLDGWGRLSRLALSGVTFAIAVLTKETALFLIPAMLYIAYHQRWRHQGKFAIGGWLVPFLAVLSFYPLYALLKGELLPAGNAIGAGLLSGAEGKQSLFDALRWQMGRGGSSALDISGQFWDTVRGSWAARDALLLVGGVGATVVNILRGFRDRHALAVGLLGLMPIVYLARGGLVFDFYILFALPFLALNAGILVSSLRPVRATSAVAIAVLAGAIALAVTYSDPHQARAAYVEKPADAHRTAAEWVKQNIPTDSYIIATDDFWADLREPGMGGDPFPNVHSHWKVAADPQVRDEVFGNDPATVDYLLINSQTKEEFEKTDNRLALDALERAHLVKTWDSGGSKIELWRTDSARGTESELLQGSYDYISARFEEDGAFVDSDGRLTSEAQSYALLRAVWSDEPEDFQRIWETTRDTLQRPDGLLSWLWRDGAVEDQNSAADADTDTALALLLGGKSWGDDSLIEEGTRLAAAIYDNEVADVGGVPYLTAGDWAVDSSPIVLNPSYCAPYAYRVFAEVDPAHDWYGLIDSCYDLLFRASGDALGAERSAGLPPNWIALDPATGALGSLEGQQEAADAYGYDATRTYWRIALDLRWSDDGRAQSYLSQAGFLADEVERNDRVAAVYAHDGTVLEEAPSMVGTAGALAALSEIDESASATLYAREVLGGVVQTDEGAGWPRPDDIYAQEWGWFAVAFYADDLSSLWFEEGGS